MSIPAKNPLFLIDFPDPCVIRVNDTYYMTTTSMHFMPGIPVMRSYDLANWEIVSYVYDTFIDNPSHNLTDGKHIYGQGSWATSLRYHNGWFYVCFNSNDSKSVFIYRTKNIIEGPWQRSVIPGSHHDPSLLFDDGKAYMVYGASVIYILELTEDAMSVKPGSVCRVLVDTPKVDGLNCEGSHMHKINGKYYLMLIQWPKTGSARRIQWCYRCDTLHGQYEGKVVLDDDMGYKNCGIAQGGFFCSQNGDWYAMLFQDRLPYGRCPVLMPVIWIDDWPVLGQNGKVQRVFETPVESRPLKPFVESDEFDYKENKLSAVWQWNHNPDNNSWTLTDRYGWLRLYNNTTAPCFEQTCNMLTQRTLGPECTFRTKLDISGLKPGDNAGLAALQYQYGRIGVVYAEDSDKRITMHIGDRTNERLVAYAPLTSDIIHLKIRFEFETGGDIALFYYSNDGEIWRFLGEPLHMEYRLEHFTGYRPALFSFSTKHTGGYADFDYLRCDHNSNHANLASADLY